MPKNTLDLRFCVRRNDRFISNLWRLWVTNAGDVYLSTKGMGGIEKYSFHQSGICRSAFRSEYGTPPTMTDRLMFKWQRRETRIQPSGQASRVALIAFPSDYLSRPKEEYKKKIEWVAAAQSGAATYIELAYTYASEISLTKIFLGGQRSLLGYSRLPSGEAFFINYYHSDWINEDLRSPPSPSSSFPELLFSAEDPDDTGRPVRIRFGPAPKDGDALLLKELGGYAVAS
jgi:hypothetical protein